MATGAFEIVNSEVSTRFSNAANADFAIYTSTSNQSIHVGTALGSSSAVKVAANIVTITTPLDLNQDLRVNGVTVIDSSGQVIGSTPALPLTGGSMTGQIGAYAPDSVSAPGYAWSNDLNTGFFQKAVGQIGITCDGTEVAAFSNQGASIAGSVAAKGIRLSN